MDHCSYDFITKAVSLRMESRFGFWKIVKAEIFYYKQKIENFQCQSNRNINTITFSIDAIERHVFEGLFKVVFNYEYRNEPDNTYETELFLDVNCFITNWVKLNSYKFILDSILSKTN